MSTAAQTSPQAATQTPTLGAARNAASLTTEATTGTSAPAPSSPHQPRRGDQRRPGTRLKPARPLLTYLLLDARRTLLHPANLFFVIAFPLAMYLIFGNMEGMSTEPAGEHGNVSASVMLVMASYSACLGATTAAAGGAVELGQGWGRQMAMTSRGLRGYGLVKLIGALTNALVPVTVVFVAGALTTAQLDAQTWVIGYLACLVGTLPFILWGLAGGLWLPPQAAAGITTSLVALFGFAGNAFMPLSSSLLNLARFTPMYGAAALARWPLTDGWTYVTDMQGGVKDELWMAIANLAAWTILFGLVVLAARRRLTVRR